MAYLDRARVVSIFGRLPLRAIGIRAYVDPQIAVTGTLTAAPTEANVVAGSKTIILTLENGRWVASGAKFNAQRQGIIDGLTADGSEATGWNAEVRDKMTVAKVVRTSDTKVTITPAAAASYAISEDETVTVTIPRTAIHRGGGMVRGISAFTVGAS